MPRRQCLEACRTTSTSRCWRPTASSTCWAATTAKFAFIGDGEVLPELKALAERLAVTDWATFTGWLDEDAGFDYLGTADIGLDTTRSRKCPR